MEHIAEHTGMIPQALQNKPTLKEHLQFYLSVFKEVERERTFKVSSVKGSAYSEPLPLRFTDFLTFAKFHRFTEEDINQTWVFVRHLDGAWLRDWHQRQDASIAALLAKSR